MPLGKEQKSLIKNISWIFLKGLLFGIVGLGVGMLCFLLFIPGLLLGLILPPLIALLGGLILGVRKYFERKQHVNVHADHVENPREVKIPEPYILPQNQKAMNTPLQLLTQDEIQAFSELIEQKNYPHANEYKIKIKKYVDLLEQKDSLDNHPILTLVHPVTVEGIKGGLHWINVWDKDNLKASLNRKSKGESEQRVCDFLIDPKNKVTLCYSGFPKWVNYFIKAVRSMLASSSNVKVFSKLNSQDLPRKSVPLSSFVLQLQPNSEINQVTSLDPEAVEVNYAKRDLSKR